MRRHNYLIFCAVIGCGLLLDQATKIYIDHSMALYASLPVVDNFFSITYLRNPGAAFGLFAQSGFRVPFLVGVSLVALVVIVATMHKLPGKKNSTVIALACIFAGACGNLIDRVRLGEVIDFLDFYWKQHHWPAFNIADSAILLGVLLYLGGNLRKERRRSAPTRAAVSPCAGEQFGPVAETNDPGPNGYGSAMSHIIWTVKQAKRLIIILGGLTVLGIGIAMIVLPGPAIVVIPIGLGILATEFVWARNLLHRIRERLPGRTKKTR